MIIGFTILTFLHFAVGFRLCWSYYKSGWVPRKRSINPDAIQFRGCKQHLFFPQMFTVIVVFLGTCLFFPSIWNNHPNWLSYFSEGLKPPTRVDSGFNTGAFFVDRPLDHPKCAQPFPILGQENMFHFLLFCGQELQNNHRWLESGENMLLPVTFSLQPSSPAGPSERLRAARTSEHPLGFARSHGSQTGPVGCSVSHWVYHKGVDSLFKSWQLLLCDAKDNMYIYVYIYI